MHAWILLMVVLGCTTEAFRTSPLTFQSRIHTASATCLMSSTEGQTDTRDSRPSIFVGNIPFSVSKDQLNSLLKERLGDNIEKCSLITDRTTGRSRGFAYINVRDDSTIQNAISKLSGTEVEGRTLAIDLNSNNGLKPRTTRDTDRPRRTEGESSWEKKPAFSREDAPKKDFTEINERSIYIGNLDASMSREDFQKLVEESTGLNTIKGCRLATFPDTGKCKGFGHVEFQTAEDAQKAVSILNGTPLNGRQLNVNMAGVKTPRKSLDASAGNGEGNLQKTNPEQTVFVGNLSWKVTKELMEEMLSDVIGPNSFRFIRVATDRDTGRPRGYAHVEFVDVATAERAVKELTGLEVLGRTLRADISTGDRFKNNSSNA